MNDTLIQIEVASSKGRIKLDNEKDPCSNIPDKLWNDENIIIERKRDGHRFKLHVFKAKNYLDSRRISVETNRYVEKTDSVPHIRDLNLADLAGSIFDGELCSGKDSNSVAHALGSHATDEEKRSIAYVVFDIIHFKGVDVRNKPDSFRRALLEKCFADTSIGKVTSISLIDRPRNMTPQQKKQILIDALNSGEEGVMLKDIRKPYGQGWTKVKRHARFDVVIMGYEPPEQFSLKKHDKEPTETKFYKLGWIGAIKFGQYVDGKLTYFGRASGIDDELRKSISEDKEGHLGRVMEISALERFPKTGMFRHPQFSRWRDDKNPLECIYRQDEV